MQRNPAKAREEIRALYARHAPRKMDAAQLYLDAGSAVPGRAQLVEEMQALARKTGDATMLVAAAGGEESFQAGDKMIAEATERQQVGEGTSGTGREELGDRRI